MPSPKDAAAKKPKQQKPIQANNVRNSNVLNFNRTGSADSEGGGQKGSEYNELVASLTKKCIKCGTPTLPWGRVGQKGDQVCGVVCLHLYYKDEEQRRDKLFKSSVVSTVHMTPITHPVESFQQTAAPQPHPTRRRPRG